MNPTDYVFDYDDHGRDGEVPYRHLKKGERVFSRALIAQCADAGDNARVDRDTIRFFCGLDVGGPDEGGDLSVLTIISHTRRLARVQSITAYPRGSRHTEVAEAVARQLDGLFIEGGGHRDILLCIDANGVGASMPELIRERLEYSEGHPFPTRKTGVGEKERHPFGHGRIHVIPTSWTGRRTARGTSRRILRPGKATVLSTLHKMMESKRLQWPSQMSGLNDLKLELGRVLKVNAEGDYPTFERRSTDHMSSFALAAYLVNRFHRQDISTGSLYNDKWDGVHAVTNLVLYGRHDSSDDTATLEALDNPADGQHVAFMANLSTRLSTRKKDANS